MARPDEQVNAHRALVDACAAVREYHGSDAIKAVAEVMLALKRCYVGELLEVTADNLVRVQTAIRQVDEIETLLTGGQGLPKL